MNTFDSEYRMNRMQDECLAASKAVKLTNLKNELNPTVESSRMEVRIYMHISSMPGEFKKCNEPPPPKKKKKKIAWNFEYAQ